MNTTPARFSLYVALAASLIVAIWAVLEPVPAAHPGRPPAARGGGRRAEPRARRLVRARSTSRSIDCVRPGETVLACRRLRRDSLLWQAKSGFRFRLAGGVHRVHAARVLHERARPAPDDGRLPPEIAPTAVRRCAREKHVDAVWSTRGRGSVRARAPPVREAAIRRR